MTSYLKPEELAQHALSDLPYFNLWVRKSDQPDNLTYLDTSRQSLMYNPETYSGSWESNLSVVLKIKNIGSLENPFYRISNVVIPNTYLEVTKSTVRTESIGGGGGEDSAFQLKFSSFPNIVNAPVWEVVPRASDNTYLSLYHKDVSGDNDDLFLNPAVLSGTQRQSIVASKNQFDEFGITYIPNFDIKGRWNLDTELEEFGSLVKRWIENYVREHAKEREPHHHVQYRQ